ncbi:group II intron reverse transcriptase/maturase [Paenibacillus sp. SYP-B3998]|uniref:Group II intron reverse transcriptase/maturase n=1 Tax=Paenibacillus sp. SYP-B3998 TaxID=2678564 RepID=A0A6G3ZUP9_9BACL|nr:group II intron reverse transcriptase/maturase [Paenibacillus sp. SYP-B3998]NEW05933.1 group II intron reverse transcriptase/maturase [Paenibacillus sp. SYP-B3998]
MTETFTDLHSRAIRGENFTRLYDTISSKENIRLAFRMIKSNQGSTTPGTDGKTIENFKTLSEEEIVSTIQHKLANYQPKQVRRVLIPKPNGKKRPLGIPCMIDRITQQCFKQVLEPIAEAHFFKHSYGFRPLRSTHHAVARVQHLVNIVGLHYVVDIDVKGFFDNVNHTLLIKQLWNMGIRDRKVLRIISKMLKAEISGEGIPSKGTPQGGILSPLLSNIVLNDLDHWVARQWETFPTNFSYSTSWVKTALKRTNLKEGYIVRYADDFKILCRDWRTAQKWYHAVRLYLKDRLHLDISPEKSQIVNLRKRISDFLGFTIYTTKKGKKRVAQTGISEKKKLGIKLEAKKHIRKMQKSQTNLNAESYNSFVLGIHNYFCKATQVNPEFSRLAHDLRAFIYNRLRLVGKYEYPTKAPPTYRKFYSTTYRTFRIKDTYLFPLCDVKTTNNMCFGRGLNPFTESGRRMVYKKLQDGIRSEIVKLMKSNIPNRSIEYLDNRISRYSMKMGCCEITGMFLFASYVHCHHYLPIHLGGGDRFDNLRILHKDVHVLIHAKSNELIEQLIANLGITEAMLSKVNQYRKMSNLEAINTNL